MTNVCTESIPSPKNVANSRWCRGAGLCLALSALWTVSIGRWATAADPAEVSADRSARLAPPNNDPRPRLIIPDRFPAVSNPQIPAYARAAAARADNTPADNPITDAGAFLGRALFYDTALSRDGNVSCASCHQQSLAFTDGRRVSVGHDGREVVRNSMPLVNLRYQATGAFFWDHRAETLEDQVLEPIRHPAEMGHTISTLVGQLQSDPVYRDLFAAAFGTPEVTRDRVAKSLAQFLRSIVSFGTRYDIGRDQVAGVLDPFPNYTALENEGKQIFFDFKCADCHLPDINGGPQTAFFQTVELLNNGIDIDDDAADPGRGGVTGKKTDNGRFKSSSLRNIDQTGPYMHDGRFVTVNSVIEHYNWSVKPVENLDPRLSEFTVNGMALPETKKTALESFLSTLTDHDLLEDPRFADPWVR